ncbi:hypothetical protein [Gulosibacter sp. GYB002]
MPWSTGEGDGRWAVSGECGAELLAVNAAEREGHTAEAVRPSLR